MKKFKQGSVEYVWRQLTNTVIKNIEFYFDCNINMASKLKSFITSTFQ